MFINPIELTNFNAGENYEIRSYKGLSTSSIKKLTTTTKDFIFLRDNTLETGEMRITAINKMPCTWREVYTVKFDMQSEFCPGDSVGIICPNSDVLVTEMCRLLGINEDDVYSLVIMGQVNFTFEGPISVFFRRYYDFRSIPKRSLLYELLQDCGRKAELTYILSTDGINDYFNLYSNMNTIIDIIHYFKCRPTLDLIARYCEFIKPRHFSLTNNEKDPYEILIGVVEQKRGSGSVYGHFSQYIMNASVNDVLPFYLKTNTLMHMKKGRRNVLMIATGTGIAPFLSYISNNFSGDKWLIYGCRSEEDNLASGVTIRKDVVYSRDKMYVTDFVTNNKDKVAKFLQCFPYIYVCGSKKMQSDIKGIFNDNWIGVVDGRKMYFDDWE